MKPTPSARCVLLLTILLLLLNSGSSQTSLRTERKITVFDEGMVAPDGLWLTRAAFGNTLTPKGPCIKVHKGYIFVTRYQGGMENRRVWLSRKKIGEGDWQHIQFPHRHVMFRGDQHLPEEEQRGDAHNNIAIGISAKDDTIHLLYDMHSYDPNDFPDDYFNYSYSIKGAAVVSDAQWSSDLFYPKQNYLNAGAVTKDSSAYYNVTYPGFINAENGDLIVKWRVGGDKSAKMYLSRYDGNSWGDPKVWNNTTGANTTGYYGDFRIFNGRMFSCWHRRTASDQNLGYENNRGLYLAICEDDTGLGSWSNVLGNTFALPLLNLEPFKIGEPSQPGERMSFSPSFVVTESGAFHARVTVGNSSQHWFRKQPADHFKVETGIPDGDMYTLGGRVYVIGLEGNRPIILSTPAGAHDWSEDYRMTSGTTYSHGESILVDGSIYFYLMKDGSADSRPIYVLRFDLSDTPGEVDPGNRGEVMEFNPVADGSLNPGFSSTQIRVERGNASRTGFFKFDLSGITGPVTAAELRLRCEGDGGSGPMRLYTASHNNWAEDNTGQLPTVLARIGELNQTYQVGNWYTWTLDDHVITGTGTYAFILQHEQSGSDAWFGSRESGSAPVLMVTVDKRPYAIWRDRQSWGASATENRNEDGDPDSDGMPNQMERAFGLNPTVPNERFPRGLIGRNGNGDGLIATFSYPKGEEPFSFEIQYSPDLKTWSNLDGISEIYEAAIGWYHQIVVNCQTGFYRMIIEEL